MSSTESTELRLYISTKGNDSWSGRLPAPNAAKNDGPLKTFDGFQKLLRVIKTGSSYHPNMRYIGECLSGPIEVHLRAGVYELGAPLVFGPEDSWPITFKPYKGEKVVISGGRRITGWKKTTINRKTAWVADLPEVAEGKWEFRQLFVNGRRADRPRFPKKDLFHIKSVPGVEHKVGWGKGGQVQFVCNPGEVSAFRNIEDVETVCLHFWIEERSKIVSFDAENNLVTVQRPSRSTLGPGTEYYLDNVFEQLSEPGEWYLDRRAGRLYYLPRKGETPRNTEVIAPRCLQLLGFTGKPEENRYVEHIQFEGITFAHTDWRHPDPSDDAVFINSEESRASFGRRHGRGKCAAASQAACDVPGVISFEGARFCAIERCVVENIGWYGVEIGDACHGIRIVGNTIRDMGAGGVKINGAAARDAAVKLRQTGHHMVTDNEIAHGGRVFHSAIGVLSMNAHSVSICHNHIHDLFYSGVSCGWEWGYQESVSRDNLIEFNHIHNIGQKLLSDMGGIYTLGVQPGTVLRNNLIHDISSAHYGGWCIYPDEGSSHILIENNVCYDADRHPFHQHYGRENMVRNNIWVFGGEAVAVYSRMEPHRGFTWMRNIMVSNGEAIFKSGYAPEMEAKRIQSDLNLFWSVKGKIYFELAGKKLSLNRWRAMGRDTHSIVADPKFRNIKKRDLRLAPNSPAFKLGFVPIDLSEVGPRRAFTGGGRTATRDRNIE